MDADKMRRILKEEYGISNDRELRDAIQNFKGVNLGIFTAPISKEEKHDRKAVGYR